MGKEEVIKRLKEHLRAKEKQRGFLVGGDKYYCMHYIMDFLLLSKKQAKQFIKENLPALESFL